MNRRDIMLSNIYRLMKKKNKNKKIYLPKRLRSEGNRNASGWLVAAASDADATDADTTAAASVNHEHRPYSECVRILPLVVPCVVQSPPQGPYFLSSAPHQTHEMCVCIPQTHTYIYIV